MDIEVYQDGTYVTTFYDVRDDEKSMLDFLCDFCAGEGYTLSNADRRELRACARDLCAGGEVHLCGFELKSCQ